ncbi:MAG: hypothetical protein ACE5JF_13060 [Anaerolineales bacterium]
MQVNGLGVKVLLSYDPLPEQREEYFRYVLGEFIPAMENLGLPMCEAWHTAYGSYPLRLIGFMAETPEALEKGLASEEFLELEGRLQDFVSNYRRKIVRHQPRFQF